MNKRLSTIFVMLGVFAIAGASYMFSSSNNASLAKEVELRNRKDDKNFAKEIEARHGTDDITTIDDHRGRGRGKDDLARREDRQEDRRQDKGSEIEIESQG